MGFIDKTVKAGLKVGKGTLKTAGGVSNAVGKASAGFGGTILGNATRHPGKTAAFIGGSAALGYVLADSDGSASPGSEAARFAKTATLASVIPGAAAAAAPLGAGVVGAGMAVTGTLTSIGGKMIKRPDEALNFGNMSELKFTKLGSALVLGGAAIEGAGRAKNTFLKSRMGYSDGMVHAQTPVIPQQQQASYANNGGATGDLVFSLYNNR